MKTLKTVYVLFLIFGIVLGAGLVANAENKEERTGTVYEQHIGIFEPKVHSASYEPLLGSGEAVTGPLFNVLDGADDLLGKTLHTKTYAEDDNDSFVTLEKEGAKLGYDF